MNIIDLDDGLNSFQSDLILRMELYKQRKSQLLAGNISLCDFANGHLYYGFHPTGEGWYYREWAPGASALHLIGDFNGWNRQSHPLGKLPDGNWEIYLPGKEVLTHRSEVKVQVSSNGDIFDRIPLYIHRAVQKSDYSFNGQIWNPPEPYVWTALPPKMPDPLLIYECHIGISGEEPHIASYASFTDFVLPRIKKLGYNAIQIMALLEHPYYGSFGYQVSSFFAASSRFGTPEDLKSLIDTAHNMGIVVLCDMVQSHAAVNTAEGIHLFDGTEYQFFHRGKKGNHPAWGTKCFNYGKPEVIHFLLSNLKYWMEEYHVDGFRFDGVTSMLYHHHGLGIDFDCYEKYFSPATDVDAVTYLQLANELVHTVSPIAVTIAEDMSGMPGMCLPIADGGIGFDYRLSMGVPDYWIRLLREQPDEQWSMKYLWHELTQRRPKEKVIGYCECHDQALVGDKTIMFWLADSEMYWHMKQDSHSIIIDRAIALHKMIRLLTCICAGEGYLNFMGNEFGHPEWIDMPRAGNGDSYHYARRQWSLTDSPDLRYHFLCDFDRDMIDFVKRSLVNRMDCSLLLLEDQAKVILFQKGQYLFGFNFHPTDDFTAELSSDLGFLKPILDTGWEKYGGRKAAYTEPISVFKAESRSAVILSISNDGTNGEYDKLRKG